MKRFLPTYACAAYLFLYLPLLALGVFSFNDSKIAVWHGFTFAWYSGVFHNPALIEGTLNSLLIAARLFDRGRNFHRYASRLRALAKASAMADRVALLIAPLA